MERYNLRRHTPLETAQARIEILEEENRELEAALGELFHSTEDGVVLAMPDGTRAYYAALLGGLRTNPETGIPE